MLNNGKSIVSSAQPYTVNTTTSSNAPGYFEKEKTMSNSSLLSVKTTTPIWYSDDERDYNYPATAPTKVTYKGSTYGLVHESQLRLMPLIDKVIFNPPATIVLWKDGTKTIVKVKENGKKGKRDKFSEEYGLAMAIAKKFFGSRSAFTKNVENASRPGKGRK